MAFLKNTDGAFFTILNSKPFVPKPKQLLHHVGKNCLKCRKIAATQQVQDDDGGSKYNTNQGKIYKLKVEKYIPGLFEIFCFQYTK